MKRLVLAVTTLVASPALAQPSAEAPITARYDRAAKLLFMPAIGGVKNDNIVPHWIGHEDRFWYQRQTDAGTEFIIVDAATGAKMPAFDAAGIATSLAALLKQPVTATALPFADFTFSPDDKAIRFKVGAAEITCVVAGSTCTQGEPSRLEPDMIASPDGKRAVFTRAGNLWLRDLTTGADRQLTTDGTADKGWGITPEPSDFHALARGDAPRPPFHTVWSPDGRTIVTTFTDQSYVQPYPYMDYAPADGSARPKVRQLRLPLVGERGPSITFYAIDVASGARTRTALDNGKIETMKLEASADSWSADGRHYRLFGLWADVKGASLWDVDVTTGKVREVIREAGTHPALLKAGGYGASNAAFLDRGRLALWPSSRDGWSHLYLYDIASGKQLRRLTAGTWIVRDLIRADDALRRVYFVGQGRDGKDPYQRSLYSVGYDGGDLRLLSPEPGDRPIANPQSTFGSFDGAKPYDPISPSGRYAVYGTSTLAEPTVTVARDLTRGTTHLIERGDATKLFAAGYRPPQPFMAKAADGSDLYGVVYRPSDYDPARRYPVILAQYDSPHVVVTPHNFTAAYSIVIDNSTPASEAELGFIVVMLDPRGTPYRGNAFSQPPKDFIADMGLTDQIAAIRQLGARDPSFDLTRVGIVGASFGAWTALRALIDHNDFFTAAVAWASPGGFANMYNANALTSSAGVPLYKDGAPLSAGPADRPVTWSAIDAIAKVGRMKGRLLLGTGALDENVLPSSQLQFLDAAARAGKDVEQMFLPRATHGPVPYWPYVVKRTWDFLVRNLRDETAPTDWSFPTGSFPPLRPDQR